MQPARFNHLHFLNRQQFTHNSLQFKTDLEQVSKAGFQITKGAWVQIQVDLTITAIIENKVMDACQSMASQFNKSEEFNSDYKKYGGGGGLSFVYGLFGIFEGEGYIKEQKNTSYKVNQESSMQAKYLANQISSLAETQVRITGTLKVTGLSQILSPVNVFVEIMTVKGKDANDQTLNLKIISSSAPPKVTDSEGNETGRVIDGKLEITPL